MSAVSRAARLRRGLLPATVALTLGAAYLWPTRDDGLAPPPDPPAGRGTDRELPSAQRLRHADVTHADTASPFLRAFERGVAAYNADDVDGAVDAFEEAVRLDPGSAEARINLGLVYLRLRRTDDALRELSHGASLEAQPRHGSDREVRRTRDATIERHDPSVAQESRQPRVR
ncbi:MAG: tetratricopeptide repeat protein [Vicinamibacterales bacterium]